MENPYPTTVIPADLLERCKEILFWRKTGLLVGSALRDYARSKPYAEEHCFLQIAENETAREAFELLVQIAEHQSNPTQGTNPDV